MKKSAIALAIAASFSIAGNVSADSMEERLAAMEKRLQALEKRVATQDEVIKEKDRQISAMADRDGDINMQSNGAWFNRVEVGGLVEIEAAKIDEDGASGTDDIVTATVELGIAAQINDWVSSEIVLLYEEESDNDGDLNVDVAMINIADPDANWFVNAGQYYVPFGTFGTNMVSDPITLDIAETSDTAIEAGFGSNGLIASAYVFQGDREDETGSWGAGLFYETEADNVAFAGHLGYINDILESDGLVDGADAGDFVTASDEAGAWTLSGELTAGNFIFIGEYIDVSDEVIAGSNRKPSIYNLEVGYGFGIGEIPATFAIGYQGSDDADGLLPENKYLTALSLVVMDGTSIAFEYSTEEDYAGTDTDVITGFLGVEF